MAEAQCRLRRPAWLFGLLGLAAMFALGLLIVVWAAHGRWNGAAAQALAFPAAVGAGLAAGAVAGRMRRTIFITRREATVRGAIGWGAVGLAWPAAFLVEQLMQGAAPPFFDALAQMLMGAAVGAAAGALAAGAASFISLTRAIERPSPAPPPG